MKLGPSNPPIAHGASPATSPGLESQPPQIAAHELLKKIGGGSYGEVWLARNVMDSYRAVKIVQRSNFEHDRPFVREFAGIQKFEPVSRSHEGLVDVLQVGRDEGAGYFYYVMELADAAALQEQKAPARHPPSPVLNPQTYEPRTLRAEKHHRGRLPLDECIQLGLSLTSALAYLHGQGLVHRDLKPSNVIFVGGVPKLADVGLVAGVDDARSYVGTEGFIPPEGPGSPQADLYSLGIVLYEMSTGKSHQDFPEPLADLAAQPDHGRWLEFNAVIHKACRAKVAERYQSAKEMHAELALVAGGQSVRRKQVVELRLAVAKKAGFAIATVGIAAVLLFYASAGLLRRNIVPQAKIHSIAVLPFTLESTNLADQFLGESLPDKLIQRLGRIPGLKVAAANSSFATNIVKVNPRSIGEKLKVRTLLEGAVRKSGDRVQIAATLIQAENGSKLWTKIYDAVSKDLPAIESDITEHAASALMGPLSAEQSHQMVRRSTDIPEAYQLYLEGSYFLRRWSEGTIDQAIEILRRAAALDPHSAAIQADLAQAYVQKAFSFDPQDEWQVKASAAIDAARQLDGNCPGAFLARGRFLWSPWSRFHHELAVKDFRHALAIDPNLTDAHQQLAMIYVHLGLFDKAREESRQALELDPLNLGAQFREGVAYLYEGRYQEALIVFEHLPPGFQTALLTMQTATTFFYLGQTNEAKTRLEELLAKKTDDALSHSLLAVLFAAGGETDKAAQEIRRAAEGKQGDLGHYHHVSYNIASAYALIKDKSPALKWLRKAAEEGYPCYPRFAKDPNLNNLRGDSQFESFMEDQRKQFEHFQKTL